MTPTQIKPTPFIKWLGGKRKIVPAIKKLMPEQFDIYFEPFCGAAALFWEILPKKAILSDNNLELVNTYICLQNHPEELIERLKTLSDTYYKLLEEGEQKVNDFYHSIRELDRDPQVWNKLHPLDRAARFIFLNKTAYGGVWRVNADNQHNTPWGRYKTPKICDRLNLLACSEALQGIQIQCCSFEEILPAIGKNDFALLDPPYVPTSKTASFTNYTVAGFGEQEQLDLLNAIAKIQGSWVACNSDTEWVRSHYQNYHLTEVFRNGAINSDPSKRSKVKELLITKKNDL